MRKVISVVIMLVSVLSICWGQNNTFIYENIIDDISNLKDNQETVLTQAKASEIDQSDKNKADSVLIATFKKLDRVMSVYNQIEEDEELSGEAQQIIVSFINSYKSAIRGRVNGKEVILVQSTKFIEVAEEYSPQFDAFYEKAKGYIDSKSSGSRAARESSTAKELIGYNEESQPNENIEDGSMLSVLVWIALAIGVFSILLSVLALVRINNEHHRISKRKQELEDAERRINHKISEIKQSNFRGTTASVVPPQPQYQPKPQQRRQQTVVKPAKLEEKVQRVKVEERPVETYLYATIKAQSPYAEFFKVATENSGDKVFMLTLANPESDVAEFTIAPDMSPDFMKSVIIDRDTYLPALFCEKNIDSSNPTRIEVNSAGRAKKVDGKWQVQERMTIRLV